MCVPDCDQHDFSDPSGTVIKQENKQKESPHRFSGDFDIRCDVFTLLYNTTDIHPELSQGVFHNEYCTICCIHVFLL